MNMDNPGTGAQRGLGDDEDKNVPTQIPNLKVQHTSTGDYHTILIDSDDNVWAFGSNEYGQLGLGNDDDENININIPMQIQNLKSKQVSAGNYHTVMIDLDNNVWGFGQNLYGQLGLDDNNNINVPTQITNLKAKQISAGTKHTVLIDLDDNVWTFGNNSHGQLGLSYKYGINKPTPVVLCNKDNNTIYNLKARQVSAGDYHTIVIDSDNNVWAFGSNEYGRLGLGDNKNRNVPTQIPNLKCKQVSTGIEHSVIIDLDNNVWTFGSNDYGELGLGDNKDRNVPTQIANFKGRQVSTAGDHTIIIGMLIV